eukprot:138014-Chlamydomonas_euryale.AAC.2
MGGGEEEVGRASAWRGIRSGACVRMGGGKWGVRLHWGGRGSGTCVMAKGMARTWWGWGGICTWWWFGVKKGICGMPWGGACRKGV